MRDRAWTKLHTAAGAGDLDAVEALLRAGADVKALAGVDDEAGRTALHCAVDPWMRGRADDAARAAVVGRLVEAGTDVNLADDKKMTPLHLAVIAGLVECCRRLLDGGARLDAVDRDHGWTALHWSRSLEVAALLLERGADPNAPTKAPVDITQAKGGARLVFPMGSTAADVAAINANAELAAVLARHGGRRVTTADRTAAQLAYLHATARNDLAAVRELVAAHGLPALTLPDQAVPLHAAITARNADLARVLIDAGHPLEARDAHGRTALLLAVDFHMLELAQHLVACGADLHATDAAGATALHLTRDVAAIEWLVGAGLDVDARDRRGRRALHRACADRDAMTALLAAGAALDGADDDGVTPLGALFVHHLRGHDLAVHVAGFLAAGASPNVVVPGGPRSAPHPVPLVLVQQLAQHKDGSYRDALATLVRGGADVDLADPGGWTALHEAIYRRFDDVIALLREAGARDDLATTRRARHYRAGTTAADVARDRGVRG